jgi:two-component system LytT family response regulator
MSRWKALIVDDERLARQDLRNLLDELDEVEILGEAVDGEDALEKIKELDPDLIFLDIQMPGMSGFDLLEKLDSSLKVVFVTAFDEYAIRAFEVNALDYLLKPVSEKRLKESLGRLETEQLEASTDDQRPLKHRDRLLIRLDNHLRFLKVDDISCIESAGDYSEVHTQDGKKHLVYKPMNEWERRLPDDTFCRIHRSTIVNLDAMERLEEWFNHSYRVYITGIEKPFVMSRRYAAKLKKKMS